MKHQDYLPHCDLGPVLAVFMIALTAGGIALSELGKFPKTGFGTWKVPAAVLGIPLIIIGVTLLVSKIHRSKASGKPRTTGIYARLRETLDYGILFTCTGAILIYGSLTLLVFPPIMYLAIIAAGKAPRESSLKQIIRRNRRYDDR